MNSQMDSNYNLRVEILGEENYDVWCLRTKVLLSSNDLWKYVNGSFPCPARKTAVDTGPNNDEAIKSWMDSDKKAKALIILTIDLPDLAEVTSCNTARDMWLKLEEMYRPHCPESKIAFLKKLISLKMGEGLEIHDHVQKFVEVVDKLASMEVTINDDLLSIMFLNSLPDSYDEFRRGMELRPDLPSLESLLVNIGDERYTNAYCESVEDYETHEGSLKSENSRTPELKPEEHPNPVTNSPIMASEEECSYRYWYLDSGSPFHICSKPQNWIKYRSSSSTNFKYDLSKKGPYEWFEVAGSGKIKISSHDPTKTVILDDVLWCPNETFNVISVSRLTDKGYLVCFDQNYARICDQNGCELLIAHKFKDFYAVIQDVYKVQGTEEKKASKRKRMGLKERLRKLLWR